MAHNLVGTAAQPCDSQQTLLFFLQFYAASKPELGRLSLSDKSTVSGAFDCLEKARGNFRDVQLPKRDYIRLMANIQDILNVEPPSCLAKCCACFTAFSKRAKYNKLSLARLIQKMDQVFDRFILQIIDLSGTASLDKARVFLSYDIHTKPALRFVLFCLMQRYGNRGNFLLYESDNAGIINTFGEDRLHIPDRNGNNLAFRIVGWDLLNKPSGAALANYIRLKRRYEEFLALAQTRPNPIKAARIPLFDSGKLLGHLSVKENHECQPLIKKLRKSLSIWNNLLRQRDVDVYNASMHHYYAHCQDPTFKLFVHSGSDHLTNIEELFRAHTTIPFCRLVPKADIAQMEAGEGENYEDLFLINFPEDKYG